MYRFTEFYLLMQLLMPISNVASTATYWLPEAELFIYSNNLSTL